MSRKQISLNFVGPILPGCISIAMSRCGKPNCACKAKPPKLHGPFYRWTGLIDGKRTTRTISKEDAVESERRIKNYRKMKKEIDALLEMSLKDAPWTKAQEEN
jgi:hypothetical protein